MRIKINMILGALIALLSGCKTPQEVVKQDNRIVVLYGPPSVFMQTGKDTIQNKQTKERVELPANSDHQAREFTPISR
jgi:hypothetical protein